MTLALVIGLSQVAASGAAVSEREALGGSDWLRPTARHMTVDAGRPSRSETACSAHGAVRFYSRRLNEHRAKVGQDSQRPKRLLVAVREGACPRYLASVLQRKAFAWRTRAERWVAEHVLSDFHVTAGSRAWRRAVAEAQRPYPGTEAWLMSCSASEGGWGRWVPNSQGSGVGGWLQFHPSTFSGFFWRARVDVARRGYIVPGSATSWYSPLGQALAGAWGITHGMRHHWAGSGCW